MKVRAWRTERKAPDDRVYISIQIIEQGRLSVPWVLALEDARAVFGDVVDDIPAEPVFLTLIMKLA